MTPTVPNMPSSAANGPPVPSANSMVVVPESEFQACDDLRHDLEQWFIPRRSMDFWYSEFQRMCHFVGLHLQQCTDCV